MGFDTYGEEDSDYRANKRIMFPRFGINNVTSWFIGINILVFIIIYLLQIFIDPEKILKLLALSPDNIFHLGYVWTIFTSMFMHFGFVHLFVNMFSLYFVGNFLEMLIGKKRYTWFYIVAGLFAGAFYAYISFLFGSNDLGGKLFGSPIDYAVGASGIIFGLVGVLTMITPKSRVYLIAGPLVAVVAEAILYVFLGQNPILNIVSVIINLYLIFSIFALFSFSPSIRRISLPIEMPFWILPLAAIIPLLIIGFFVKLPIGNMAHIGGLIIGLLYGYFLRLKYKNKIRAIERYFSR